MQEVTSCPVCRNSNFSIHFPACKDYSVSHETFTLIKCINCSFVITSPRPSDTNIAKYYASDNYISHSRNAKGITDKIYFVARNFTLKWKLNLINQFKENRSNLLDYGCGTGEFLNTCYKAGWKVTGVEPSSTARTHASNLNNPENIYPSILDLPEKTFDIITLWHVLEHVPDPGKTLQELKSRFNKNGILFIAVPNHNSYDSEYYKHFWAGYDVPRHFWHFSKENMKSLLEANSFNLIKTVPMKLDSFYVSMLSEKYLDKTRPKILSLIKAAYTGLVSNLKAVRTGNYSSLIYIAEKR